MKPAQLRERQAWVLFDAGFGKGLHLNTIEDDLETIPPVPQFPTDYRVRFDRIILVDRRLAVTVQCGLLGVAFAWGNDDTFVDVDPTKRPGADVYWMACQAGRQDLGCCVLQCRLAFGFDEVALTHREGLAVLAQNRGICTDHFIDLPGSIHRDSPEDVVCLELYGGRPRLRFSWGQLNDAHCGAASRGECVG